MGLNTPAAHNIPGEYGLTRGVGALAVALDPRESLLSPAPRGTVTALWPGARVVSLEDAAGAAFAGAGRASLAGPLLWLVLVLGCLEVALASGVRRST